jgi:hypothetical protein
MPRVEFEHTIPVFERTKIVHALDRAATVRSADISRVVEILNDEKRELETYHGPAFTYRYGRASGIK